MRTAVDSEPLGRFGVEVGGIDLGQEMSPELAGFRTRARPWSRPRLEPRGPGCACYRLTARPS